MGCLSSNCRIFEVEVYDPETRQNVSYSEMLEEDSATMHETYSHRGSRSLHESDGAETATIDLPHM